MGVSRIFLGNFNFEHELAPAPHGGTDRAAHIAGSDRDWAWVAIAKRDDIVLTESQFAAVDFSELAELGLPIPHFVAFADETFPIHNGQLVSWGWTESVRAIGNSRGWECVGPPIDVVRQVNSRAFRYGVECEWNIGLAGSAVARSLDELEAVVQRNGDTPRGWLLKANFGMSGREARRGRGTRLDDNTRNWALRRLQISGPIVFEPIVERVAEAGIQIDIPQSREPELVGVTPLLIDRSGVYRGSRFACPTSQIAGREMESWQAAVDFGLRLANRLQALGYFGPLGVDAMKYRDETGEIRLRPLQDINARYTMGRLALGFRRILPVGWCGSWLHYSAKHLTGRSIGDWINGLRRALPGESRLVRASQRQTGSQFPESHAVLLLAPTVEILKQAESAVFDSLGINVDVP